MMDAVCNREWHAGYQGQNMRHMQHVVLRNRLCDGGTRAVHFVHLDVVSWWAREWVRKALPIGACSLWDEAGGGSAGATPTPPRDRYGIHTSPNPAEPCLKIAETSPRGFGSGSEQGGRDSRSNSKSSSTEMCESRRACPTGGTSLIPRMGDSRSPAGGGRGTVALRRRQRHRRPPAHGGGGRRGAPEGGGKVAAPWVAVARRHGMLAP